MRGSEDKDGLEGQSNPQDSPVEPILPRVDSQWALVDPNPLRTDGVNGSEDPLSKAWNQGLSLEFPLEGRCHAEGVKSPFSGTAHGRISPWL